MKTVKRKNFAKTTAVRRDSLVIVIRFELSPGGKGCGFLFKRTGVRLPYYRGKKQHKTCIYDCVRTHARTLPAAAQGERIGPSPPFLFPAGLDRLLGLTPGQIAAQLTLIEDGVRNVLAMGRHAYNPEAEVTVSPAWAAEANWLRPTAIRRSDGFPAPPMPASETHSVPGPWSPGRAAGSASGSPGSPRSGPSRWSSWHSLDWCILRPAGPAGGAPRNWPTGFRRTREPWGSSE